ncbi:hypothetical protein RN001_000950 [Aquatica leii]|uniref:Right handed beta helix domain-containing protein n=1 Tax=Aquatica leii TaxID=1421715 RepID=A0AAN7PFK9_9COLE|nr:hypothetical protein RN001_000950 [Aquatica leii]
MNHVLTYNKTLQERLQEYIDVFGGYEALTVSQITQEWAFFLEITIDNTGWQAIWKVPRSTCQQLKIEFPTLALVYVESICYTKLTAQVSILLVDEEIDLPKKHTVPLIQLWPTEKQDETVCLNLSQTANAIDMLRFFYLNLLMPWDEENNSLNWLQNHLLSRLHLFYNLRNGTILEDVATHIKGLLTEARHIQEHHDQLTQAVDIEQEINPDFETQSLALQKLLDLRVHMMHIKNELELMENSSLCNFIISEGYQKKATKVSQQLTYWIVFEQGQVTDFLSFLRQLQTDVEDVKVKFQSTFALALENANVNDTIFLCNAKYVFTNLDNLQEGGVIKGISSTSEATLSSTNEDIVLDCRGNIVLENLNVDITIAQCGILVRSGIVVLKNCTIVGDYKSSTQQGAIVLAGGELHMDNCTVQGFFNGIVVNSGGVLSLNNSKITNVKFGLKCYDKSDVKVQSTTFTYCQKYSIFVETDNHENKVGDFDLLLGIEEVKVLNVTGENNEKGNVKINHKCQLEPISDLFSNHELDPTIIQHSDGEEWTDDHSVDEMEMSESPIRNNCN